MVRACPAVSQHASQKTIMRMPEVLMDIAANTPSLLDGLVKSEFASALETVVRLACSQDQALLDPRQPFCTHPRCQTLTSSMEALQTPYLTTFATVKGAIQLFQQ